jgi:hypothetical protein
MFTITLFFVILCLLALWARGRALARSRRLQLAAASGPLGGFSGQLASLPNMEPLPDLDQMIAEFEASQREYRRDRRKLLREIREQEKATRPVSAATEANTSKTAAPKARPPKPKPLTARPTRDSITPAPFPLPPAPRADRFLLTPPRETLTPRPRSLLLQVAARISTAMRVLMRPFRSAAITFLGFFARAKPSAKTPQPA